MSVLKNFFGYLRFYTNLKSFLEKVISEDDALRIIKQRLISREENFLRLAKNAIFLNVKSPYLALFKHYRISYDDVEKMVKNNGLDVALKLLKEKGIYLTIEEFKGKRIFVRDGVEFKFREDDFDNPFLSNYYSVKTGGTRSRGTRTLLDLDFFSEKAVYYPLIFKIHNLDDCKIGLWAPAPPLGAGILPLLHFAKAGKQVLKWFSPIKLNLMRIISFKLMQQISKAANIKLPYPEYAAIKDVGKVVDWIIETKAREKNVLLLSFVSGAVRICEFAKAHNLDISGVKFWIFGEPLTKARNDIITSCGCHFIPVYSFIELGSVGFGCSQRKAPEEVHLFEDSMALIQYEKITPSLESKLNSFLFTSILPSSPKILLNVENGDYGVIEKRPCNCILGELGLQTHLSGIQSFEKLNTEGMTFFVSDLACILEEILPPKFGGSPLDYQISEEIEGINSRLILLISPKVGDIDEGKIKQVLLDELKNRSLHGSQMIEILKQADSISIKRKYPETTRAGKVYPLSIQKK